MKEIKAKFRKNLMHALKYTDTRPKEPIYINDFLGLLHQYIQKLKQEQPDLTVDQLREILNQDIFELSKSVYSGCIAPDMYMEYACALYLMQHPQEANELFDRIEKEDLETSHEYFQSQENFTDNLMEYVLALKKDFPEILKNFSDEFITAELEEILSSSKLSPQEKNKKAESYIKSEILPMYQARCRLAVRLRTIGVRAFLPEDTKLQEKDLRNTLVKYISDITSQLKKLGLFDRYNQVHTSQMRRMKLPELTYSNQDLEVVLNPNYLAHLPIDDLLALGVFWLNRYTKELDTYSEAMFAIEQFDLLPQMLASDDIGSITVPDDQLKEMLLKMHTLYYPCETFFQEKQAEYDAIEDEEPLSQEEEEGNYILFSYDPLVKQITEDYGGEYEEYFQVALPNLEHNLEKDVRLYAKMQNPISSAKTTKDDFITSLLLSLEINPNLINGGIILDDLASPEDIRSQRFVGIALDCNLTTPMRQHIRLDVLKDFLQSFTGNTKIQIYEGNSDFREWFGKTLSNSLCIPFSKKSGKAIKDSLKKKEGLSSQAQKYLQHLEFLRDSKHVPDHLKTEITNAKGKKEKVFQKRYIDLSDGKVYRYENNEYVLFSPEEAKKGDTEYDDDQREI